jgi:hypothetical protein
MSNNENPDNRYLAPKQVTETADCVSSEAECRKVFEARHTPNLNLIRGDDGDYRYQVTQLAFNDFKDGYQTAWNRTPAKPDVVGREVVEAIKKGLAFYANLESYLAQSFPDRPGFDFKHTHVHNDSGDRARYALGLLSQIEAPTPLSGAEREKAVIIRHALEMAERAVCDIESPDAQATYHAIANALEAMKGGA